MLRPHPTYTIEEQPKGLRVGGSNAIFSIGEFPGKDGQSLPENPSPRTQPWFGDDSKSDALSQCGRGTVESSPSRAAASRHGRPVLGAHLRWCAVASMLG